MATSASQVFDSGPSDASGKVCKRCNSKVLNAFTKCAKCDEYYHTSCIKILLDRGKKFCVITESVMLCEEHCREIHNIEEAFHKVLKKVNYQNSKLKETVEEMKEEIDSLTAQLAETRQTLDAKSLVGKVREELSQQFLSFKKEVQIQIDQKFNTLSNGQLRITENVKNVLHQDKQLYSEALKPSKDVVILKPKSSQNANVTFETLQDKINPEEVQVGITKVKRLRNGSVAIACCNQEEANKLEEEVKTKMGKEYEVKKVKPHNPKIKIVGFNNEMTEEELKQCLINQNSSLKNMKGLFRMIVCKKMKNNYFAIIEVDPLTYSTFINLKSVFVKWKACSVFEHVNIIRCYKCGGFNHMSKNCQIKEILCLNCGKAGHTESECHNNTVCINCSKLNNINNINIKVNHSRFDYECEAYRRQVAVVRSQTVYEV
jgi:hypothetical protein